MNLEENDCLAVQEDEVGERIDKVLAQRFQTAKSRSYFQFLIEEQRVLVNGSPVKKRYCLQPEDEILIHFILTPEMGLTPELIPLNILYEDEDLIVVNKPAGMVVHPAPGHWNGTFANALLGHCKNLSSSFQGSIRPGIVHRLDKDTSGLLIGAKSALAHQRLIEIFSGRQIEKEYLTICIGNPGRQEIRAPIGRHPVHRKLMAVVPEKGRDALTFCETISHQQPFSLVRIRLATGRTHQIRVHFKHIGCPILGDNTYGSSQTNLKYGVKRQFLHASSLRFLHPITNKPLEFKAMLAEDLSSFIQKHFKNLNLETNNIFFL